jgi:hypothetical protein
MSGLQGIVDGLPASTSCQEEGPTTGADDPVGGVLLLVGAAGRGGACERS